MPMVTVASLLELDAAEALLELHGETRPRQQDNSTSPVQMNKEIEESATAAIFLNSLFLKRVSTLKTTLPEQTQQNSSTSLPVYAKNNYEVKRRLNYNGISNIKRSSQFSSKRQFNVIKCLEAPIKKRLVQKSKEVRSHKSCWSDIVNKSKPEMIKHTCDSSTQTEVEYQLPQIEKMETIIKDLCGKIETLENKLKMQSFEINSPPDSSSKPKKGDQNTSDSSVDLNGSLSVTRTSSRRKRSSTHYDSEWESPKKVTKKRNESNKSDINSKTILQKTPKIKLNLNGDLVPIGDGNASVPGRLLKNMNWSSYTSATRKLLRAVFPRNVLATHSLTGKPSPAFPNKPAKKQLDPALVNDIVQTVVENCSVPESVVRTSITTKCADESKMFRSRMRKSRRSSEKINQENIPPTARKSEDSDDDSYLSS